MDMNHLVPGDPVLVESIVSYLKAKGIFDEFRHECLADVDTKSSCQNLSQRVDGYTTKFLAGETWHPDMNKNELRNKLRRHLDDSGMLAGGADHVAEQVINPKVRQLFLPRIIQVVHQYLNEENEKINRRHQSVVASAQYNDSSESSLYKYKTCKIDPIADILSFSLPKPKTVKKEDTFSKMVDASSKTDKKKEDSLLLPKTPDVSKVKKEESTNQIKASEILKAEKKKEEVSKMSELATKPKKVDPIVVSKIDLSILDKKKDVPDGQSSTAEPVESISEVSLFLAKSHPESKEQVKVKLEAPDSTPETQKQMVKDEFALEKKLDIKLEKIFDDSKIHGSGSSSEEGKSSSVASKSSSLKIKSDSDSKHKAKAHSTKKSSHVPSELHKHKHRDSSDSSKTSSDKHSKSSSSSKSSKPYSKDMSTPPKSSSQLTKSKESLSKGRSAEKSVDAKQKIKPSKSGSSKTDGSTPKLKVLEKQDKHRSSNNKKQEHKSQTVTSTSSDKKGKSLHFSASYDSSQSDFERNSSTSADSNEKHKHFSKHCGSVRTSKGFKEVVKKKHHKSSEAADSKTVKNSSKTTSSSQEESTHELAKISSRSDSIGSTSSASDSHTASDSRTASESHAAGNLHTASDAPITSDSQVSDSQAGDSQDSSDLQGKQCLSSSLEDVHESSEKESDKSMKSDGKKCRDFKDLPSPPPPPPPPSTLAQDTSSSAEASDAESSEGSESDSDEEKSSSDAESEEESDLDDKDILTLPSSSLIENVYDIFLYSSSSSEFEGFHSSPEKASLRTSFASSDVSVSSVNTSDLSSSHSDESCEESETEAELDVMGINVVIENARTASATLQHEIIDQAEIDLISEDVLEEKSAEDDQLSMSYVETASTTLQEETVYSQDDLSSEDVLEEKSSAETSMKDSMLTMSCEEDTSPPPEPKRESRRERKLNPKYASSEYTSIFNSRKTSFITKLSPRTPDSPQSSSSRTKKTETDAQTTKRGLRKNSSAALSETIETQEKDSAMAERVDSKESSDNADRSEDVSKLNSSQCDNNHNAISDSDSRTLQIRKVEVEDSGSGSQGVKRKLFGAEEKGSSKRPRRRNSGDSCSSETAVNENRPCNNEKNSEPTTKNMFRRRAKNNGDVLLRVDHVKKNPLSKPNHVVDKTGD